MLRSSVTSRSGQSSAKRSPEASAIVQSPDGSIETLISWLVASKRSLSSIHAVHRATNILTEARAIVESTAALVARTRYIQKSLQSQLKILRVVQTELESTAHNIKIDINATNKELELVDRKLQNDIDYLTQTRIEAAFKPLTTSIRTDDTQQIDEKHTLHDFVDDEPVRLLREGAQDVQRSIKEARSRIDASIVDLEDNVQRVIQILSERTAASSSIRSDSAPTDMSYLLQSLETNAHEMAHGLESLVQHFDSCVNAIKNTEGAGAAVAREFTTEDLPEGVDVETFQGPVESMLQDERLEMLRVLSDDAAEVDDVVTDIQGRGSDMEIQLEHIAGWRDSCVRTHRDVAAAFHLLEKLGERLPDHVKEVQTFSAHWHDSKNGMEDYIAGMSQLCEMYENFLGAYDGMIVEAARRRAAKKKMDKIVQEAQSQLDKLYEDDISERELFRTEQGEFLPSDIWHGLHAVPPQYSFEKLGDEGLDSVPELPRDLVGMALRRIKAARGID